MRNAAAVFGVNAVDQLVKQHRVFDERLKELGRHAYLTPAEQVEVKELKKLKLAAKDRITDLTSSQHQ